jgi:hypothetical protein
MKILMAKLHKAIKIARHRLDSGDVRANDEQGGEATGKARKNLETETGKRGVSRQNYLQTPQSKKRLKRNE